MSITSEILPFIPQRAPFVMVDSLEACTDKDAVTHFIVKSDNLFINNSFLSEPALVENIAQTAAAHMGYICAQENKPVPVGFIGAVQHLKIQELPRIGDKLVTHISIKNQIFNATIIEGLITANGKELASCEMKIFVQ